MRRTPDKNPFYKKQQEKLTPQQVWKNASMIIGTKKKEQQVVKDQPTLDFSSIQTRIKEINEEKIKRLGSREEFMRVEIKNSLFHIPDTDNEDQAKARPKVQVPDFFPKQSLNVFESPEIYKRLDIDTLFFIFYSQPNTVQQYYAATQLKLYSWRFHTKYRTWFQRLDEPMLITTDYERGDFLFFG